ncbi:TRAP transporter substrate-binding protein DctP, partial [Thermodesulfobacteriota bacterium]
TITSVIFSVFFLMGVLSITERVEAKPVTLIFTTHQFDGDTMCTQFFKPWFKEIEERSGGQVKIEPHWGGELASPMEAYEMTEKGIVDMAHFFPSMVPGKFVMDEIMMMSPYTTNTYRLGRVYWELHKAFPEMQAQFDETKLIWKGVLFQSGLGTMKKKVLKLGDVKGMRITAMGDWHAERLKAIGASPQSVGPADAFMAAQRGLIDGFTMPAFMLDDFKFGEVTKYMTLMHTNQPLFAVVLNLKKWNSLPADIQKIFEETAETRIDLWDEIQKKVDIVAMKSVTDKYGTEFIEISQEELARFDEADKTVQERYVAQLESKGQPGKALKKKFLKLMEEYSD